MNVSSSHSAPVGEGHPEYRAARIAVVIGIGRYTDPAIPDLIYGVADAEAFHKVLVDPERGRFDPDNVKLLTGPDATKISIQRVIGTWLPEQVAKNPEATAVIFFCGHGECEADPRDKEADGYAKYLLPVEAEHQDLRFTALQSDYFTELLKGVNAKGLVIFLDACFAGAVAEGAAARGGPPPASVDISNDIHKRLEAVPSESEPAQASTVIIAASRSSQRSWEHQKFGHGIFTHHLIEALSGKADFNNDGYIGVRDVYKYLEEHVPEDVLSLCRQRQTPVINPPLAEAPNLLLAEDASRLKEIKWGKREAELDRLYQAKPLTRPEYREALKILEEQRPPRLYANLIRLLDKDIGIEIYQALRDEARGEAVVEQPAPTLVQQPSPPGPTPSVEAAATPEPSEPSVSVKWSWKTIVQTIIGALFVGGISFISLHDMLFSPRIDMVARDIDWEPRSPKIGQVVTFTGKFSAIYRVRQGLHWRLDEIAGKELADTFTATWSVDGRQTDIVDPRKIKTGDIVDTRFETTFLKPGSYTIGFSIRSRAKDADESNDKMMRTISVLESN